MHSLEYYFRKEENKFDHIISLGYNCEVSFRFLKFFNFEESNLFNWSFIPSIQDLIYALNNFDKIGSGKWKNPSPLWQCENTNIYFHGKAPMSVYINNMYTDEILQQDKDELISRLKYLKEKFIKISQDTSLKLYIYKIKDQDIDENINEKIIELLDGLKKLGAVNLKLLIVAQKSQKDKLTLNNSYILRFVKYFADDNCVTSKKFKNNGWNKIYDEFYCSKKDSKIKKYKFDTERN